VWVIKNKKIFFTISTVLAIASIIAMIAFGFNYSVEFTGGTIIEVTFPSDRPRVSEIRETISSVTDASLADIRETGESGISIRLPFLTEDLQGQVVATLAPEGGEVTVERVSVIGPSIGQELKQKAVVAIVLVILAIVLFIAFAFRKVSAPRPENQGGASQLSSWKYGVIAVIALVHDILIPTGVFVVLGFYFGYQLDVLFVTAILTILGYSVNDTIVIFDRIRENLKHNLDVNLSEDFSETVGKSLRQTITRSINTSLTTLLVLIMLLFVGSEATRHFALVLVVGIISGAYSSIFLASPLLVAWERRSQRKPEQSSPL
jgi:preprotein translocase subunit SecF